MLFLELRGNPNFPGILNWILQIYIALFQSRMNKNVSLSQSTRWEEKILNRYIKGKPQPLEKFHAKSDKKQKIFFCTPVTKFQKISTSNMCNEAKQIYPNKQKKASKKRYSKSFRSSYPKVLCKKGVLKNFATCLIAYYWNRHQVVDKNLSNLSKTALPSISYFEKVLFFADQSIKMCWNCFY